MSFDTTGSGFCPGGISANYVTQWWNNVPSQFTTTAISVTTGGTQTGINAAMAAGGSISGKVTAAAGGANLAGICVNANPTGGGGGSGATTTAADGTYTITGLAAGSYDVQFSASGFCGGGNYATEWYNNQTSQFSANTVAVTAGSTTGSINAAMAAGGSISGKVTAAAGGADLAGICVNANPTGGGGSSGATTAADGTYTITGLAAGSYDVQFSNGCGDAGNYATQWYNNQTSQFSANTVAVTAGSTTGSINAAMAAGGSISGKVTAAAGGANLAGICVNANPTGGGGGSGATTAADGTYTIAGLAAGSYDVQFSASGFCGGGVSGNCPTQWYNNQTSQFSANAVAVTAGSTTARSTGPWRPAALSRARSPPPRAGPTWPASA